MVASGWIQVEWENSGVVKGDVAEEISRLKQEPGRDLALLGSSPFASCGSARLEALTSMGTSRRFESMTKSASRWGCSLPPVCKIAIAFYDARQWCPERSSLYCSTA